jgi:hypothetical protein
LSRFEESRQSQDSTIVEVEGELLLVENEVVETMMIYSGAAELS